MRKVLLATTALVAMTGYAAADVSLSAYYEFGYTSISDDTTTDNDSMFSDSEYHISFTETTDSGLTFAATFEVEGSAANQTSAPTATSPHSTNDESSLKISTPEMGSFVLGMNDEANYSFQTWLPGARGSAGAWDNQYGVVAGNASGAGASLTTGLSANPTANNAGDNNTFAYFSPNMGGVSIGLSTNTQGDEDNTAFGISYTGDLAGNSFTVTAAQQSDGESTETEITTYGVSFGVGSATIAVASKSKENGTYDTTTTGAGIGVPMGDSMNVYASISTSEDDVSKDTLDVNSIGMDYTIASGLNFAVSVNNYSYEDSDASSNNNDASEITASIQANF
jgi:outer membrane protein OmpU